MREWQRRKGDRVERKSEAEKKVKEKERGKGGRG